MSRPVVRQWKSCWKWASWGVYFETALQLHSIVIFRKVLFQKMEFCNRKHVAGQRRRLKPKKKKQQKQRGEKEWWISTVCHPSVRAQRAAVVNTNASTVSRDSNPPSSVATVGGEKGNETNERKTEGGERCHNGKDGNKERRVGVIWKLKSLYFLYP